MTTTATPTFAIPGQLLGPASRYQPGPGTHLHEFNLYASLLGQVQITQPARAPGPAKRLTKITPAPAPAELPTISVMPTQLASAALKKREVLPQVGNVVLCRVIRITPRQAVVAILVCGDTVLEAEWQGLIRVQDVRATEKDRVKIYESFRPGDIVRAEVISLGDQVNYYLSTTRNELGVISAVSEAGNTMVPISWKELMDPKTGLMELRKVAQPQ
ncbi:putative exosome 3 [Parathielavia appendiculata]|uniref:Exosome 3 n=1 Tax=Parathielavia appendiculata TaxID=2587402 RepID=A0AAN6U989_9PEZI|nr:putative exosome 3 [Parathielavia appendiculata]